MPSKFMSNQITDNPADYIVPLNINGLDGRMLHLPAPTTKAASKREILFVYGHHSSLERWWGVAQVLNRYGAVTMPDMPGFGGMDSFYKIGKKPTIDNLADYLAAFIKLRYKRKKVIIAGMSVGFVVVTRMLQRYPELCDKVSLLVSVVGFAHHEDFTFSKTRFWSYMIGTKILSHRLPARVFRYVALNRWVLRSFYGKTHNAKHKYAQAKTPEDVEKIQQMEVWLWQNNDPRTWAFTTTQILTFDNCIARVDLPVWHVATKGDHFFDNHLVEQHMRVIFKDFHKAEIDLETHAPSVIANAAEAAYLVPPPLRRAISRVK